MKKLGFMAFFLTMVIIFSALALPASAKDVYKIPYDGTNTGRTENALIVFSMGGTSTGTNEYGYEVVCDANDVVISMGGNDNAVPANGMVLSAHGTKIAELQDHIQLGDIIIVDKTNKLVVVTEDGDYSYFYKEKLKFTAKNATRGENETIIFDQGTTTGTNEYGWEAAVDAEGYVISVGGNNKQIPEGGFVVSVHGTAIDAAKRYIRLGAKVTFSELDNRITAEFDENGMYREAVTNVSDKKAELENAKATFKYIDITKAEEATAAIDTALTDLKTALDSGSSLKFNNANEKLSQLLADFDVYLTVSKPVETRGIWIRPTERSDKSVKATVDYLAKYNINTVYLEAFYNGGTILLTPENALYSQLNTYLGFDIVQSYIDNCKEYGIDVKLWVTVFQTGSDPNKDEFNILARHPEWMNLRKDGTGASFTEYGDMYFLNPALPEVREALLEFYGYVLDTYDIDGFQLDYIRYPNSSDGADFGYDEYTRGLFNEKYGEDPINLTEGGNLWEEWCDFRCSLVTEFVAQVRELVNEKRPDIELSADVFASLADAKKSIMQDPLTWIENGYVDTVFPMSYGEDGVLEHAIAAVEAANNRCFVNMGTATYMGFSPSLVVRQADMIHTANADGVALFEMNSFITAQYGESLINTVFKTKALSPFAGTAALTTYIDYIKSYTDDSLAAFGGISADEAESIKTALDGVKAIADGKILFDVKADVLAAIDAIVPVGTDAAKQALAKELTYLRRIAALSKPSFEPVFAAKPIEVEEEEPVVEPEPEQAEPVAAPTEETEVKKDGGLPTGAVIGIVAAVCVVAAAAVVIIIKKKKK